jgi:three-Cys-motif partner protein
MSSATDEAYWADYSNLQHVKHRLIRRYLGGWFPKLGAWSGQVLYVDTHAGRGRHLSGNVGSPLVALHTLIDHHYRNELLKRCEFQFHFVEIDQANYAALQEEIRSLGALPRNIQVVPHCGDAFSRLDGLLAELRAARKKMAPAFIFVDPYGFKIPGRLLRELMLAGRVELFVNVIWRELAMALSQEPIPPGMAKVLSDIFDGEEWRTELTEGDFDARADRAVDLLAAKVGAEWATFIRMLGDTDVTRYLLVHFSNHPDGRDLMKEAMWSVSPDGGFYARKSEDPSQQVLISPEPDLRPLRDLIERELRAGSRRWQELHEIARPTVWRDTHVNQVVRDLRKKGVVAGSEYHGKFGPGANPLLALSPDPGKKSGKSR